MVPLIRVSLGLDGVVEVGRAEHAVVGYALLGYTVVGYTLFGYTLFGYTVQ
jgi:hypothetical protein